MTPNPRLGRRLLVLALAFCSAHALPSEQIDRNIEASRADAAAAALAAELAQFCPVAPPESQDAVEKCRKGLYASGSQLRKSLPDFVLWGRQRDPKAALKDTSLTQFGPDVLSGMYLALFMFNGQYTVQYVESEGMYQIRMPTAFRNRLAPGQFPYPFWHDANKWATYQGANEVLLWWDPKSDRVRVAQFTVFGPNPPLVASIPLTRPAFDGQWLWTDAQGRTQPQVTVFDGLFRPENPYIGQLDTAYKSLAMRLREGQCDQCHIPSNPDKMKRLVLLQTPAHAGAEIKRLIKVVQDDKMPRDEVGIEQPLSASIKGPLLRDSKVFDALYDAAKQWEAAADIATPVSSSATGVSGGREP